MNGSSPGTDGIVDFIYIIYRNSASSLFSYGGYSYTAIAHLELSSTINTDGVQIVSGGSGLSGIGSGVQQRGGYNGRDYTLYVSAHEMGHYLFGGGHIDYASNLCLMSGLPVWNASRGMHSWERQRLGWINYTDKSTDGSVTMSDYMTQDEVYRVPISSSEYFLIENRKKLSPHDKAGDIGFYFYRVTNATSFPPTIDVLCADGNWDFSINTSTQTLIRTTPNVNGEDEMSFYRNINGITYACYTPVYNENSAWGDAEDAFDLTFNNVFSPASNPRNTSSLQFSIEVIGTDQITFYFDGDGNGDEFAGSPSKPQNLHLTYSNPEHPSLAWDLNTEPDISNYKIYRSYDNSSFYLAGVVSHPTNTFIDYEISYTKPIWEKSVKYYVVAVDNTNLTSLPSNQIETAGIMQDPLPKLFANNNKTGNKKHNFSLFKNYPNPFNPTTTIRFSLPEASFVTLKVYDILGREITELINEVKPSGEYEVEFDGTGLPSGTYIYRLTAGKYSAVGKMALMK